MKPSHSRQYRIWNGMISRCHNPNRKDYPNYGGKGIRVCDKWKTFNGFWEDMSLGYSETLQIDRIDGTKGYEPGNCRWATPKQQQRNRRSNVVIDTPKGRMTLVEASEAFCISYGCLKMRWQHWPKHRLFEAQRPHVRK